MKVEPVLDLSYNKRPAYRLGASCDICGWKGEVRRELGFEPNSRMTCPNCGCRTVRPHLRDFRGRDA